MTAEERGRDEAHRLGLHLKAKIRESGHTARDISEALDRQPGYLTRVFAGRLDLHYADVFRILGELGASPERFLSAAYPPRGNPPEKASWPDHSPASPAVASVAAPALWVAATVRRLKREIILGEQTLRDLSVALALAHPDTLSYVLGGRYTLRAWHVLGVLHELGLDPGTFFRDLSAEVAPTPTQSELLEEIHAVADKILQEAGEVAGTGTTGRVVQMGRRGESS